MGKRFNGLRNNSEMAFVKWIKDKRFNCFSSTITRVVYLKRDAAFLAELMFNNDSLMPAICMLTTEVASYRV